MDKRYFFFTIKTSRETSNLFYKSDDGGMPSVKEIAVSLVNKDMLNKKTDNFVILFFKELNEKDYRDLIK